MDYVPKNTRALEVARVRLSIWVVRLRWVIARMVYCADRVEINTAGARDEPASPRHRTGVALAWRCATSARTRRGRFVAHTGADLRDHALDVGRELLAAPGAAPPRRGEGRRRGAAGPWPPSPKSNADVDAAGGAGCDFQCCFWAGFKPRRRLPGGLARHHRVAQQ